MHGERAGNHADALGTDLGQFEGTSGPVVIADAHICLLFVTKGVEWTVEGKGLPPPGHTQGRWEWHPKMTLPRSLRRGRAGTAETGDEACRGLAGMCCQTAKEERVSNPTLHASAHVTAKR